MNRWTRLLSLGLLAVSLSAFGIACNTMEGAGKDVENAGDAVKDTARDAKN